MCENALRLVGVPSERRRGCWVLCGGEGKPVASPRLQVSGALGATGPGLRALAGREPSACPLPLLGPASNSNTSCCCGSEMYCCCAGSCSEGRRCCCCCWCFCFCCGGGLTLTCFWAFVVAAAAALVPPCRSAAAGAGGCSRECVMGQSHGGHQWDCCKWVCDVQHRCPRTPLWLCWYTCF